MKITFNFLSIFDDIVGAVINAVEKIIWDLFGKWLLEMVNGLFTVINYLSGVKLLTKLISEDNPISSMWPLILGVSFTILIVTASIAIVVGMQQNETAKAARNVIKKFFLFLGVTLIVPTILFSCVLLIDTLTDAFFKDGLTNDISKIAYCSGYGSIEKCDWNPDNPYATPDFDSYNITGAFICIIALSAFLFLIALLLVKRLLTLVWLFMVSPFIFALASGEESSQRMQRWKDDFLANMILGTCITLSLVIYSTVTSLLLNMKLTDNNAVNTIWTIGLVVGGIFFTYRINMMANVYFGSANQNYLSIKNISKSIVNLGISNTLRDYQNISNNLNSSLITNLKSNPIQSKNINFFNY